MNVLSQEPETDIGRPTLRGEDRTLVVGGGCYTDDIELPGLAHAAVVRSTIANGLIASINVTAALAMPGVLAVYTGDDLAAYGTMRSAMPATSRDGAPMLQGNRSALARGRVSFVGDPLAFVVAQSRREAIEAAEAVVVDIEALPATTEPRRAVAVGGPVVFEEVAGNVALDFHHGQTDEVARAFATAAHVTKLRLIDNRVAITPMEPRSVIADFDRESGRITVYSPTQGVIGFRQSVASFLGVPPEAVRVISRNVGGSFGMKSNLFPETIAAIHAARELRRPVKWTSTRSEAFLSDYAGRDHDVDAELALDKDGRFLAVRLDGYGNLGAFPTAYAVGLSSGGAVRNTPSVYQTPLLEVSTKVVFTHTPPISAYRGAGRPEGNYFMERLIDTAAEEMGIDRIELRRRNHVRPQQMPFTAASALVYDSGDFPAVLERALKAADWEGFAARKAEAKARGRLRGIGVGQFLEVTAPGSPELAHIAFGDDGTVTLFTGTHDQGQGHWTTFGQILVGKLGIPFDAFRLAQTDSDLLSFGGGTGGEKSVMAGGNAVSQAADLVIERGKEIAAHMLEASVNDVDFGAGRFTIAGTDRSIALMEVARRLGAGEALPGGIPPTLDVSHKNAMVPPTFPNGAHVAEVEIDPDTGLVEVVKYVMVNDFGTLVNPMLVEGQLHGGVVQGIGQSILEATLFGEDGQLITGSFMDYAMPRAEHIPPLHFESLPTAATTNPLGIKGCGEAGPGGAITSVMNAIMDALAVYGIRHLDMPATPLRVWEAIAAARGAGGVLGR